MLFCVSFPSPRSGLDSTGFPIGESVNIGQKELINHTFGRLRDSKVLYIFTTASCKSVDVSLILILWTDEKTMLVLLVPYLIIGVLLVVIALLVMSLRISRKVVARLLIDEIYYHECRSNLFFKNIDNATVEQSLHGNLHRLVENKHMQSVAWWVAVKTEGKLQRPQRPVRVLKQRDLSLT